MAAKKIEYHTWRDSAIGHVPLPKGTTLAKAKAAADAEQPDRALFVAICAPVKGIMTTLHRRVNGSWIKV